MTAGYRHSLWLLLLLLLAACGGLGGEPQIVATVPQPTAAPTDVGYPSIPPDMAQGAAIFAARCTDCHGEAGAGDGPLVQSGQISDASNLTIPETASSQRPTEWFGTITDGNIAAMMPPWGNALTESERWSVAYYTYTLHYTQAQIEEGRAIFQENCARCHGETGTGDGPDAADLDGAVSNLTDLSKMALLSDTAMYNGVSEGVGHPPDGMPAFADDLSEEQRQAVVAFIRTLPLVNAGSIGAAQNPAVMQPEAAPEMTVEAGEAFTLSGQLTNGSAGGTIPAEQPVTLFVFPTEGDPQQFETVAQDGTYHFADVPFDPDYIYAVTSAYRDRIFATDFVAGADIQDGVIDLTIYELTEDPSVISINAVVTQVNVSQSGLEIAQVWQLTNESDRAYTTSQLTPDGRHIGLLISLPPGAIVPGFNEPGRYAYLAEQYTVIDTAPVLPGDGHLVQLVYLIDYEDGAIIEQPLNYRLDGEARLLVRPPTIQVDGGDLFPPIGDATVGQNIYSSYGSTSTLNAGDILGFTLTGRGGSSTVVGGDTGVVSESSLPLIILLVVIGEVLLVGGLIFWFARRRARMRDTSEASPALIDALVKQISELDSDFEAGKLDQTTYQRQRATLKARLAEVMDHAAD
ncbi:MAG: c-type cytochrome [Anaerolineae bacterium]|nr:c-type cytochrome [Anaerolineae bacterium]